MDSKNLNHLIKKSLETYDIKNKKYSKYINNENVTFDRDNIKIKFDDFNDTFNYQVLGTFLPYNNVWLWSWMVPQNTSREIKYNLFIYNTDFFSY